MSSPGTVGATDGALVDSGSPAGGRPDLPSGLRAALSLAALAAALALGLTMPYAPLLPLAVAGVILFFIGCVVSPVWALAAFVIAHVAIPVYLRIPAIGPLPPTPVAVAMLVGLAIASLIGRRPGWARNLALGLIIALLVFDLIALQSLVNARTGAEGINMWFKVCVFPFCLMLVCLKTLRGPADVERIFGAMLLAGCAISFYAVVEFAMSRNYLLEKFLLPVAPQWSNLYYAVVGYGEGAYRSFSVFSNPLEFAGCASMIYPYAVVRFSTARSPGARLLFGVAGALCVCGVATTFSRGPVLALAVTTAGVCIIQPWSRRFMLTVAPIIALGSFLGWAAFGHKIEGRVTDVANITLRLKLWETAADMFGDHPLRGVGIGNFPDYELDVIRDHRVGPFYEFGGDSPERTRVAENTYLQLAAECGIIGVAAFAALLTTFFAYVIGGIRRQRAGRVRDLYITIGATAVAYLENGLTVTAYTHYVTTMLLLGVMMAALLVLRRSEIEANEPISTRSQRRGQSGMKTRSSTASGSLGAT